MARRSSSPAPFPPGEAAALRRAWLRWYDANHRPLPWRTRPVNPYRVLVSEFMLQQTPVRTVLRYWPTFIERFPSVRRLADAALADILAAWSGMGYYRRAHHLHAAATRIVSEHGGRVPDTVETLRSLPGVGRYTAGAVASIAYGRRVPVVDGNVARVLARLCHRPGAPPRSQAALWQAAGALIPARRAGDFNQAMMELGALICLPAAPSCGDCPIARWCAARKAGAQADVPASRPRAARSLIDVAALAVLRAGRILLTQRPFGGLWAGLWDVPTIELRGGSVGSGPSAAKALARRVGVGRARIQPLEVVTRQLTHRTYRARVYLVQPRGDGEPPNGHIWCDAVSPRVGVSSAARAIIELALASERRSRRGCGLRP